MTGFSSIAHADPQTESCNGELVPNEIADVYYSPETQLISYASQFTNCLEENVTPVGTSVTYASTAATGPDTSIASSANSYYGGALTLKAGLAPGLYTMTATFNPDTGGLYQVSNSPASVDFYIRKAIQKITVSATPTSIGLEQSSILNSSDGLGTGLVSYEITAGSESCLIIGPFVTGISEGSCTVTATKAEDANYERASNTVVITVSQVSEDSPASQTIAFTAPADQAYTPSGTVPLSATGGASGEPVTFASNSTDVCTVSGSTATMVSAGSCSITASQAGNTNFEAASDVSDSFNLTQGINAITFNGPPDTPFLDGSVDIAATALSGLPVSFTTTTAPICSVAGNTVTFNSTGLCSITASQAGDSNYGAATDVVQTFLVTASGVPELTSKGIATFITNRANHILNNQPDLSGFLTGANRSGGGSPGNLQLNGNEESMNLAFSSSLSQLNPVFSEQSTSAFGAPQPVGQTHGPGIGRKFDVWTEIYGSTSQNGTTDSDLWVGYFGTHYFISPDLLVGGLVQVDWADETNATSGSSADGTGWMVGPYLAGRMRDQNVFYEARAAWGRSENNITPLGTYTDSFSTQRWLARAKIGGNYSFGDINVRPEASISWFQEKQESYTDSLSTMIPSQTVSLGEVRFGPNVSRTIQQDDGTLVQPSFGISGVWNFGIAENAASQGSSLGNEDLRARLDAGLSFTNTMGWTLATAGFYDGIGLDTDTYQTYGGNLKLTIPLQ
ncbi:MAG: autotransporter outer membrane beta-barrel domain-containing protein [Rhizobiaceae bacterium]|nr:autotransporter outer membrane beta-barrel domain-containing protein [Rhizobiaceae bacterium]